MQLMASESMQCLLASQRRLVSGQSEPSTLANCVNKVAEESIRRGADYEAMISTVPIKRWGSPDEIAEACVFLCSEKASLITGIDVRVDGGKCIAV
jgi:NAD(P)-dependent dehydrogenase (short-subunit alcohol dehydrogenase family)